MHFKTSRLLLGTVFILGLFAATAFAVTLNSITVSPAVNVWQKGGTNVTFNFTLAGHSGAVGYNITEINITNPNFTINWALSGTPGINVSGWTCTGFNSTWINCTGTGAFNFTSTSAVLINVTATTSSAAAEINHTWTIRTRDNDTVQTTNETSSSIDGLAPRVVTPQSNLTGDLGKNTTNVRLRVNSTDAGGGTLFTVAGNGTNVTMVFNGTGANSTGAWFEVNTTGDALGCANPTITPGTATNNTCTVRFYFNDSTGNLNGSTTFSLKLDNANPGISNAAVNDSSINQNTSIRVNVTFIDANNHTVLVGNDTNSSGMSSIGSDVFQINITPFDMGCDSDANCTIRFYGNDSLSNINGTITLTITVDDTDPSASISLSDKVVVKGEEKQTITCSSSDSLAGIATETLTLDLPNETDNLALSCGDEYDPVETGDYTATYTATDNAGNSKTVTDTFEVRSAGGGGGTGGGAGGTGGATVTKSHTFGRLEPGTENKAVFPASSVEVKEIIIEVNNPVNDIKITIVKRSGQPAEVTKNLSGKVYTHLDIKAQNLDNENIASAKVRFRVTNDWLSDNNVNKNRVALHHWTGSDWEKLDTFIVIENGNEITYEAETSGFSPFAIAESAAPAPVQPPAQQEPQPQPQPQPEPQPDEQEPVEEPTERPSNLILAALIIVIVAVVAFFAYRKK